MKKLLERIKEAAKEIKFNDRTTYIAVCKASFCAIEGWTPMEGSRPIQYLWLVPEISHRLGDRAKIEKTAKQLKDELGYGFEVHVCPTKNNIVLDSNNFIVISEI